MDKIQALFRKWHLEGPSPVENYEAKAWRMDTDIAAALIAHIESRDTPLFIDYEHHTLTVKGLDFKALADGLIESLSCIPGQGLFAKVAWTDTARQHIQADEYRFIRLLFGFDLKTGAVRLEYRPTKRKKALRRCI